MGNQIGIIQELVSISNKLDSMELYALADQADLILKQAMPPEEVSEVEKSQFGQDHPTRKYPYIPEDKWPIFLEQHVEGQQTNRNRKTVVDEDGNAVYGPVDTDLIALTPGQMLAMIKGPKVQAWFDLILSYDIPEQYKYIIMVPCAASKPWDEKNCAGHYYPAYNKIKKKYKDEAFWITITEPLGIVPETHWGSFPAYDAPGVFKNKMQQAGGVMHKDWLDMFGEEYELPFDWKAREEVMNLLGEVIAKFINRNQKEGRRWISFIDGTGAKLTTHREMVDIAKTHLKNWLETNYEKTMPGHLSRHKTESLLSEKLKEEIP